MFLAMAMAVFRVIAGDHHDANARRLGLKHRVLDAVALGVDGSAETAKSETVDDLGELDVGVRLGVEGKLTADVAGGHGEDAERLLGELIHLVEHRLLAGGIERLDATVRTHDGGALLEDVVGGTLDVRGVLTLLGDVLELGGAGGLGHRHHHLAEDEGNLKGALERLLGNLEQMPTCVRRR